MKIFQHANQLIRAKFHEYIIPQKAAFISAMSRSGTWRNREFFFFFNELLNEKTEEQIITEMVAEKKKLQYFVKVNEKIFKLNAFLISHWHCPGFEENYNGNLKDKWNNLEYYNEDIPTKIRPRTRVFNINYQFNPYKNKKSKIIFYYRNPLDQCVALYNAIQKSTNYEMNFYFENQKKKKFQNLEEFIEIAGIDMYLKHFLSFKLTSDLYPKNLLLLTYEDMVTDPEKNFFLVLKFLELDFLIKKFKKKFLKALEMSSIENIKKIEKLYGRSINNSYVNSSNSQIINGKIGNWKNFLKNDSIDLFEKRFRKFNLEIKKFNIN